MGVLSSITDNHNPVAILETLNSEQSIEDIAGVVSSSALKELVLKLSKARELAEDRERRERRRREEEERIRKEREEKERRESHIRQVTSWDLPMDWTNVYSEDVRCRDVRIESIPDALVSSLVTLGKVDIEYISSVTGEPCKKVIETLKGSIYQNPETWGECFYKGWETSDEYLSGNLRYKLNAARKASEDYDGYFDDNVRALERLLPQNASSESIYVTLGSPWIPADVIDDFILQLFGYPWHNNACDMEEREESRTRHDEYTGTWEIPRKSRYNHSVKVCRTFGTDSMEALYILEHSLNLRAAVVMKEIPCPLNTSGKKRVVDQEASIETMEKQRKLIAQFRKWIWADKQRRERLEDIYTEKYCSTRRRVFDGSFLTFPTMSRDVSLFKYQKDAVARIIFSPNTLLAHDVGAGKTYVMIAAGQEMLRMGISKRNMYVVPNNIVGQWREIFQKICPQAKPLFVEPRIFAPANREKVLGEIRDGRYESIVIAYSCFESIPLSRNFYMRELAEKKARIEELVNDRTKATSKLRRKMDSVEASLAELSSSLDSLLDTVYFDELGITRLFVDEAHNFKNVPLETKLTNVLGITNVGLRKCKDMMDKIHLIQKENAGKGVVLATGTPITNSITDIYVMQQYLQSGELALMELQSFDSWVGMFAERSEAFEVYVDTSSYRIATRFSKFHNLPELASMVSDIADFHRLDRTAGIPESTGYKDCLIPKTGLFEQYLTDISRRVDMIRKGIVPRNIDNMLKVTTDGRKAALDLRLVSQIASFAHDSKVARCVENIVSIYGKTSDKKSAQFVFCDVSTPKDDFNLYDEVRCRLVASGIPGDNIAFIHDAETERERSELFKKVRNGEIRVLIGSTFKLGLGVNVQDRLIALHHLDVPWRPADMVQREGRILRQGNMNPRVEIFRYITEGSFDAYSWQLLETKQRFIESLLSGSTTERTGGDVSDTVLNYAEVKALATGNPLVKKRIETANELSRLLALQQRNIDSRMDIEDEISRLPEKIKEKEASLSSCREDAGYCGKLRKFGVFDQETKKSEADFRKTIRERLQRALDEYDSASDEKRVTSYNGFEIILPSRMVRKKPFVYMVRKGRYKVDLGETEIGNLIRIDNFLETLESHCRDLEEEVKMLKTRLEELKTEFSRKDDYVSAISDCQERLAKVDEDLGVNINE